MNKRRSNLLILLILFGFVLNACMGGGTSGSAGGGSTPGLGTAPSDNSAGGVVALLGGGNQAGDKDGVMPGAAGGSHIPDGTKATFVVKLEVSGLINETIKKEDLLLEASGGIIDSDEFSFPDEASLLSHVISYSEGVLYFSLEHQVPNNVISFIRPVDLLSNKNINAKSKISLQIKVLNPSNHQEKALYWGSKNYLLSGAYPKKEDGTTNYTEDLGVFILTVLPDIHLPAVEVGGQLPGVNNSVLPFVNNPSNGNEQNPSNNDAEPVIIRYPHECLNPNGNWHRTPIAYSYCREAKDCPVGYEATLRKINSVNAGHYDHVRDLRELLDFLLETPVALIREYRGLSPELSVIRGSVEYQQSAQLLVKIQDLYAAINQLLQRPCNWVQPLDYEQYELFEALSNRIENFLDNPEHDLPNIQVNPVNANVRFNFKP